MERKQGKLEAPTAPDGPEWALKKAYTEGQRKFLMELIVWLEGRTHYSPDEAQNTEE